MLQSFEYDSFCSSGLRLDIVSFIRVSTFIKEHISHINKRRLLVTDPEIQRDEVIAEHVNSTKPTVLISPSLHTGLDLKDDLSRFQVITKVPYPNIGDRWINEKRKAYEIGRASCRERVYVVRGDDR